MNKLAKIFLAITIFGIFLLVMLGVRSNFADFHYEKQYSQYWSLADKSSTIQAKAQFVGQFYNALTNGYANGDFADNDAIFLKTPNNSFQSNLQALKSLRDRLAEIQTMNPSSFEYNTAIQQITAQEQGEATAMLNVFSNCWTLNCYTMLWGWIGGIIMALGLGSLIIGFVGFIVSLIDI